MSRRRHGYGGDILYNSNYYNIFGSLCSWRSLIGTNRMEGHVTSPQNPSVFLMEPIEVALLGQGSLLPEQMVLSACCQHTSVDFQRIQLHSVYINNNIIMSDWSTKGVCLVITSPPKRTWLGAQSCMCSVVGNNKKCDITLAVLFYLFGHSDHWMSGKALAFLHLMSADMLRYL